MAASTPENARKYPKYFRDVSHLTHIDVYAVHQLFGINDPSGCIQHASKKLLLSGTRTGGKSALDDIREARDTLNRYLEMHNEKAVQQLNGLSGVLPPATNFQIGKAIAGG